MNSRRGKSGRPSESGTHFPTVIRASQDMTQGPIVGSRASRLPGVRLLLALVVLVPLEILWFRWFLIEPLPNAKNVGSAVHRSLFAWQALPAVIPGTRWSESHLGMAFKELSHVENLLERLPLVFAAGLIAAAAIALGSLLLRLLKLHHILEIGERIPLAFGLGCTGLSTLTLMAGRLGLLATWPVRVGLVGIIAAAIACRVFRKDSEAPRSGGSPARVDPWLIAFALVAGPFLVVMALGAMLPTIDFDALEYHLQGPKEYYQSGRIAFLPHNVYTSMPFNIEMLHLLGMEVLGDWWRGALVGQLLVMLHAPFAAALIAVVTRRIASPRAAWVAAVVYISTPWVYRLAAIPYVEGPLCYYHAALIVCGLRIIAPDASGGPERGSRFGLGLLLGLLAGGAMACKYTELVFAVAPLGVFALIVGLARRSAVVPLAFAMGCALAIGPWLIKNVIDTGNPVYPLGYRVFGGGPWSPERELKWNNVHGPRPFSTAALWNGVIDIAGRSDWQSPLFTALAPLALLRPGSRRAAVLLWAYAAYLFGTWLVLTHQLDRFWLPILPVLAILAGLGADWARNWLWSLVLVPLVGFGVFINFVYICTSLAGLNQWTDSLDSLRTEVPAMINAPLLRLDTELPSSARVLLVGQASVFHLQHEIIYNTVFDDEIIETIARDQTPARIHAELKRRGITHVYVDWFEIDRHSKPGGYGFTKFVTPALFAGLVESGVLEPAIPLGGQQELYRVH